MDFIGSLLWLCSDGQFLSEANLEEMISHKFSKVFIMFLRGVMLRCQETRKSEEKIIYFI